MIKLNLHTAYQGSFKIEKVNVETGEKEVLADWFDNRIVDGGLDYIGQGEDLFQGIAVGTDNAPTVDSQKYLNALVTRTSTVQEFFPLIRTSTPPYYVEQKETFRTSAFGSNADLREIGTDSYISGPNDFQLFCRSLIMDSGGTPITLSVQAGDVLDVTYRLRMYKDYGETDLTGSFDIVTDTGTVTHNFTLRMLNAGGSGAIGPIAINASHCYALEGAFLVPVTDSNAGYTSREYISSRSQSVYVAGSHERDIIFYWGLNNGNLVNKITGFLYQLQIAGDYQAVFTPVIDKDNTKTLTVSIRNTWGRTTP